MKQNTTSWAKKASSFAIMMALATLMTGTASARGRILFQDDIFSEDYSEGFMFNADDGGDEDVTLQLGNDGTDGIIIWDDGDSSLNIGDGAGSISLDSNIWDISAAGVGSGFTGFTSTGRVDFTGASNGLGIPTGAANPATCTVGDIFLNTTDSLMYACTAVNTWTAVGPSSAQDFESVYAEDADNTLTATGTFDIDATGAVGIDSDAAITVGGAGVALTSDGGALALTGDGAADVDISNAGAAVDLDAANFDIDLTSAFTLDAATAAITSTTGDVTITSADDIIFDDAQLTGVVQLTDTATDWAASLPSDGIIDNINAFTTTANGEGASLVGLEDAAGNFTSSNIEGALAEFSSNANGEGASIVGIEDAAGNFTATDVEGALTELANAADAEVETLRFYPEYADAVYDGQKGKLTSEDDATEGNAYKWKTRRNSDQNMVITKRFELPADFTTGGDFNLRYKTADADNTHSSVAVQLYNVTDATSCGSVAASASAAWATENIGAAAINGACTQNAGDIMEIIVTMMANNTNSGEAFVGYADYDYAN